MDLSGALSDYEDEDDPYSPGGRVSTPCTVDELNCPCLCMGAPVFFACNHTPGMHAFRHTARHHMQDSCPCMQGALPAHSQNSVFIYSGKQRVSRKWERAEEPGPRPGQRLSQASARGHSYVTGPYRCWDPLPGPQQNQCPLQGHCVHCFPRQGRHDPVPRCGLPFQTSEDLCRVCKVSRTSVL